MARLSIGLPKWTTYARQTGAPARIGRHSAASVRALVTPTGLEPVFSP